MQQMLKHARGVLLLCLMCSLPACETLRAALTPPPPAAAPVSADEKRATCPHVPQILTAPVRAPSICKDARLGDDYQACLEGLLGEPGQPETGALGACNQDKADIRERLSEER